MRNLTDIRFGGDTARLTASLRVDAELLEMAISQMEQSLHVPSSPARLLPDGRSKVVVDLEAALYIQQQNMDDLVEALRDAELDGRVDAVCEEISLMQQSLQARLSVLERRLAMLKRGESLSLGVPSPTRPTSAHSPRLDRRDLSPPLRDRSPAMARSPTAVAGSNSKSAAVFLGGDKVKAAATEWLAVLRANMQKTSGTTPAAPGTPTPAARPSSPPGSPPSPSPARSSPASGPAFEPSTPAARSASPARVAVASTATPQPLAAERVRRPLPPPFLSSDSSSYAVQSTSAYSSVEPWSSAPLNDARLYESAGSTRSSGGGQRPSGASHGSGDSLGWRGDSKALPTTMASVAPTPIKRSENIILFSELPQQIPSWPPPMPPPRARASTRPSSSFVASSSTQSQPRQRHHHQSQQQQQQQPTAFSPSSTNSAAYEQLWSTIQPPTTASKRSQRVAVPEHGAQAFSSSLPVTPLRGDSRLDRSPPVSGWSRMTERRFVEPGTRRESEQTLVLHPDASFSSLTKTPSAVFLKEPRKTIVGGTLSALERKLFPPDAA